ncbi:MAG: alanine racemase [Oscillospiraceae bacterium]|nr:alanine racemase [Oscillospiraceae bacterium]
MLLSNTYAKIDLDTIEENFLNICRRAGKPVMAVVKADAYGHGAVPVARLLEPLCAFFGVSSVSEALELRGAGLKKPILILGHAPRECYGLLIQNSIRPTIFCLEDAKALSHAAQELEMAAAFHFAVDTGMGRIGFPVTEAAADLCAAIAKLPGLIPEGLFSHFATADEEDLTRAKAQAEKFREFDEMLRLRGVIIPLRHLENSAGIMNFDCPYEMARAGIVIYGLYPSGEVDPTLLSLKPAMSWHSRVTHVKWLVPGQQVSYGGTWEAIAPTRVATVAAGYADGYRRSLSGKFYVLIRGHQAPILGRVCMDQFMVDVTHIPEVCPGDEVVLMGASGKECIRAEALGAAAESFNYEQVCDISRRVTRIYYRKGEPVEAVDYLQNL